MAGLPRRSISGGGFPSSALMVFRKKTASYEKLYSDCLEYIDSYWDKIIFRPSKIKVKRNILDIPHPYLVPNIGKFRLIFYWDSFFMSRGLFGTKREKIIRHMVNNFIYLYEKYHFIPNFNAPASMGRSQPPFLTSMILDAYEILSHDKSLTKKVKRGVSKILLLQEPHDAWLKKAVQVAIREYSNVWIDSKNVYHHQAPGFTLSRFGDSDLGYAHSSELESGWDFTSRFYNRCDEFLPVDLNIYLYKYEKDFEKISRILGETGYAKDWNKKAKNRMSEINRLMWNEKKGFYYDYNYQRKSQSLFLSLAGFVPLWAGIATYESAKRMVKMLPRFETDFGLTITDRVSLAPKTDLSVIPPQYRYAVETVLKPKQWDFPNIWPPLEYLTVIGLLRYGFIGDATRTMEKSLKINARLFRKNRTFFEKINGIKGDKAEYYYYATQSGFGWTNAVFYRYVKILDEINSGKSLYVPGSKSPPYTFAIYH